MISFESKVLIIKVFFIFPPNFENFWKSESNVVMIDLEKYIYATFCRLQLFFIFIRKIFCKRKVLISVVVTFPTLLFFCFTPIPQNVHVLYVLRQHFWLNDCVDYTGSHIGHRTVPNFFWESFQCFRSFCFHNLILWVEKKVWLIKTNFRLFVWSQYVLQKKNYRKTLSKLQIWNDIWAVSVVVKCFSIS